MSNPMVASTDHVALRKALKKKNFSLLRKVLHQAGYLIPLEEPNSLEKDFAKSLMSNPANTVEGASEHLALEMSIPARDVSSLKVLLYLYGHDIDLSDLLHSEDSQRPPPSPLPSSE